MQFDLMNARTFKDLWNEIQGLLSTCPVFKHFQGLEFRRKKASRMRGNRGMGVELGYNYLYERGCFTWRFLSTCLSVH